MLCRLGEAATSCQHQYTCTCNLHPGPGQQTVSFLPIASEARRMSQESGPSADLHAHQPGMQAPPDRHQQRQQQQQQYISAAVGDAAATSHADHAGDDYARPFASQLPPGYETPHGHAVAVPPIQLGTIPPQAYASAFQAQLLRNWCHPNSHVTLPQVTAVHPAQASNDQISQLISQLQALQQSRQIVPRQSATQVQLSAPLSTAIQQPVRVPAAASASLPPRAQSAPRPIPTLSTFPNLAALWRLYDLGEPHINRPALRELEAENGSEWRSRDSNDRKRWSEISIFATEVIRRAGAIRLSSGLLACGRCIIGCTCANL